MARIGRPPLDNARHKAVMIRVNEDELTALKAAAALAGKPVGTWLREMGLAALTRPAGTGAG